MIMKKLFTFSLLISLLCPVLFSCSPKIPSNKPFLNYVNNPKDTATFNALHKYYEMYPIQIEHLLFLSWKKMLEDPFSKLTLTLTDNYINILNYLKESNSIKKKLESFAYVVKNFKDNEDYNSYHIWISYSDLMKWEFLNKFDKDTTNKLPLFEKNHQLLKNFFEDLDKNSLKWNSVQFEYNYDYEFAYFAKFYLELYKKDLTEPFSYYIFAAYSAENEEIRNWLNNNSEKVIALEDFLKNYQWQKIQEE